MRQVQNKRGAGKNDEKKVKSVRLDILKGGLMVFNCLLEARLKKIG